MEFSRNRSRRLRCSPLAEIYPFPIQFYEQPPTENVSLQEFENFAMERLKFLKCVETLGVSHVRASEAYNKKLESEFRKLKFPYRVSNEERLDEYEIRRKDHISHFILRLAYCQSEDLRRWFIQQELEVFRFRFNELHDKQLEFLKHNDLEYQAIETNEKEDVKKKLADSGGYSSVKIAEWLFYKVNFTEALELVRVRKVFVKKGFAYIPHPEIVIIVLNEFRQRLSKSLAIASRSLPVVQSDERLQPLLNHLSHAYVGQNYSVQKNVGKISLEQIDSLAVKSYPPCMRQLHKAIRDNHHLRHGGRMQYGLFLKGIGLTLEQALQFWKSEFIRGKVDPDKFDKLYAYNIRHSFGKEGKRTDYTPFSCMKIILSNPPSQGDYHGCPFRHSDIELLKQKLQTYKIASAGITQILDLVKGMHYQLACQKYFELTHNIDEVGFSLTHPNQYFNESQKLLNSSRDIKRESSQPDNSQWSQGSQATGGMSTSVSKPTSQVLSADMDGLEELLSEGYV
ncbi:DNA primase large subunit [Stegostoma tigrinum]|uniref:DNA primase large subunit n=1 Tax=Stegostoma tigrinum TaxID=3053191 RepID=UPI00202B59F7|nr:DNA primase large subunit [Stegostoma tigrinum]